MVTSSCHGASPKSGWPKYHHIKSSLGTKDLAIQPIPARAWTQSHVISLGAQLFVFFLFLSRVKILVLPYVVGFVHWQCNLWASLSSFKACQILKLTPRLLVIPPFSIFLASSDSWSPASYVLHLKDQCLKLSQLFKTKQNKIKTSLMPSIH